MARKASGLAASLAQAVNEKDVENVYRAAFSTLLPNSISSPFQTDGLLEHAEVSALLEFKYEVEMTSALHRAAVLVQAVYYLKQLALQGRSLPKVIFIGDKNECFALSSDCLTKYLDEASVDWSTSPSGAAKANPKLVAKLAADEAVSPFVYSVDEHFDLRNVVEKMRKMTVGLPYAVTITPQNLVKVFSVFEKYVVTDDTYKKATGDDSAKKKVASDLVNLFFTCLTNPDEVFLHPNKENVAMVRGKEIKVRSDRFRQFFQSFKQKHSASEIEALTSYKDRILEEAFRRRTGAFFTPDMWADEAHRMLAATLGEDWKEEYVVWDCAAGTAQLTRNAVFNELYISTVDTHDLSTIEDCDFNPEAVKFQYDFLDDDWTDDLEEKVPKALRAAFQSGKKILFLINPPYGTATDFGAKGTHKGGIAKTKVNQAMLSANMGACSQQLYAQFLYRILRLKQKYGASVALGLFSNPLFLCGASFSQFRRAWYAHFRIADGMLFQASHFADVSGAWGILFSVWQDEETPAGSAVRVKLMDVGDSLEPVVTGEKTFYDSDGRMASEWVREPNQGRKAVDAPQMTSAVAWKPIRNRGMLIEGSVGYMANNANSVYDNATTVFLLSSCASRGSGFSVTAENFDRAVALFLARRSIVGAYSVWHNQKDEYLVPEKGAPGYVQWNADAVVYSLFNYASQQSALRRIDYSGKKWDVENHWFFMSHDEMAELADSDFPAMYQDAKTFKGNRFVYDRLEGLTLSPDAQAVLVEARMLVRGAMEYRRVFHENSPEFHLKAWDAGWAQHKPLLKQFFAAEFDRFSVLYRALEDRLRQGVYQFGFLRP